MGFNDRLYLASAGEVTLAAGSAAELGELLECAEEAGDGLEFVYVFDGAGPPPDWKEIQKLGALLKRCTA